MQKGKIGLVIGLSLIVFLGLAWWFWSLGSVKQLGHEKVRLIIEKGTVLAATKSSGFETKAETGLELEPGDKVRTSSDASAVIQAYGRAEIRLDGDTSLTISEAHGGSDPFLVRVSLQGGRIWSGLVRLLDLDSGYEIHADKVVATVRGTSFAFGKEETKSEIWMDRGGITASANGQKEYAVGGQWVSYQDGNSAGRGEIDKSAWANDSWIASNRDADARFMESALKTLQDSLGAEQSILPDAWNYGISLWSEKLHLAFSGNRRHSLWSSYYGRKLGQVYILAKAGKSGLAYQRLSALERELENALSGKDGQDYRRAVRPIIGRALLATSDIAPGDVLFRYKLGLEDLYAKAWDDDAANNFYARSLVVDARLDEAERFDCMAKGMENVREAINAVEQGLAREKADYNKIVSGLDAAKKNILEDKLKVQELRLKRLGDKLKACETTLQNPPQQSDVSTSTATSTQSATSTLPIKQVQGATTTKPKLETTQTDPVIKPSFGLVRIELTAQPNPIEVGGRTQLFVKGYKRDGSSMDVTPYATFQILGGVGTIIDSTYTAAKAGSVTIQANVPDGDANYSSTASITIQQAVTLSSLSIKPASATVYPGQSQAFTATAVYSNGFSKDVTAYATWSASSGSMSANVFTAGRTAGSTTITCKYVEDGKTLTAQSLLQVMGANNVLN